MIQYNDRHVKRWIRKFIIENSPSSKQTSTWNCFPPSKIYHKQTKDIDFVSGGLTWLKIASDVTRVHSNEPLKVEIKDNGKLHSHSAVALYSINVFTVIGAICFRNEKTETRETFHLTSRRCSLRQSSWNFSVFKFGSYFRWLIGDCFHERNFPIAERSKPFRKTAAWCRKKSDQNWQRKEKRNRKLKQIGMPNIRLGFNCFSSPLLCTKKSPRNIFQLCCSHLIYHTGKFKDRWSRNDGVKWKAHSGANDYVAN